MDPHDPALFASVLANAVAQYTTIAANHLLKNGDYQKDIVRRSLEADAKYRGDAPGIYPIRVNYRESIRQMLVNGDYDCALELEDNVVAMESYVPDPAQVNKGAALVNVHLVASDTFEEDGHPFALSQLFRHRRPLNLPELLAFGKQCPDFQRICAIPSMGTILNQNGKVMIPYLSGSEKYRFVCCLRIDESDPALHNWGNREWLFACTSDGIKNSLRADLVLRGK
jgi:hypothetical protein